MKTDTKKMSPISKVVPSMENSPEGVYYNPNKHIPDDISSLQEQKPSGVFGSYIPDDISPLQGQKSSGMFGSFIKYMPTLFFTPVKVSARLAPSPGTVDKDGMDDLIKTFKTVAIDVYEKNEDTEEEKEETQDPAQPTEALENKKDQEEEQGKTRSSTQPAEENIQRASANTKLGRYETVADTHKRHNVPVIRSYRLEDEQ